MDMNGSQRIEASREAVYAALNDVEVLRQCIPGCESIEKTSDTEMNAKVTLKIASGLTYVTRTDRSGIYRVRGLGKQVKPDEVVISCAKDGYQQARVVRRPSPRGKTVKSVETECRMQRQ